MSKDKVYRIGMIGGGTVGGGVYEIITTNKELQKRLNPTKIEITKICVRDISKKRDFDIDTTITKVTDNVDDIVKDDTIDCVVEVMGGTGLAKSVVLDSIKCGKDVVTANKALLAEYLEEVESIVKEKSNDGVSLGYEASVCGGIPIINLLQSCYLGDHISQIMGICNGTTNYMLGKMENGADYTSVLKEAQDLGYAEADPSADVEGYDVRAKIAILAKLAYGVTVSPISSIPCKGITNINASIDFKCAKLLNCTIKLIGAASMNDKKSVVSIYVTPKMISTHHSLSTASGCGNIVTVQSNNLGIASYSGPGAGRYPTAHSIVNDIYRVANSSSSSSNPFPIALDNNDITLDYDYKATFYIRFTIQKDNKIKETDLKVFMEEENMHTRFILNTNEYICFVTTEEDGDQPTNKVSRLDYICGLIKYEFDSVLDVFYMPIIL